MKGELGKQKEKMSYVGYYILSDFAKLKGCSKQYVCKAKEKFQIVKCYGREWFKFDDGALANSIRGIESNQLDVFMQFGFTKRLKSLVQNDKAIVDVKRIDKDFVSIRFYNENGDVLCCHVKSKNIEVISSE